MSDTPMITALLLGVDSGVLVAMNRATAGDRIASLVGGEPNRMDYLTGLGFWVARATNEATSFNPAASMLLTRLVQDARDGRYPTRDSDRATIHDRLACTEGEPRVHGNCLITGLDEHNEPAPLPEPFHTWLTAVLGPAQPPTGDSIRFILSAFTGIPADHIDIVGFENGESDTAH